MAAEQQETPFSDMNALENYKDFNDEILANGFSFGDYPEELLCQDCFDDNELEERNDSHNQSTASQQVDELVQQKIAESKRMCFFCGSKARCKSQLYGPCCAADVRGAYNQAKRRGAEQLRAYQAIKKRGGPEFIACIQTFKAECAGHGRGWIRPAFDFAAYEMALVMASRVQKGSKSLWMNKQAYVVWYMGQHPEVSAPEAEQHFHHQLEILQKRLLL